MALNSLAKQGRFSEVLSLLEAMESASIKPTEVTFGTAINGAAPHVSTEDCNCCPMRS